MSRALMVSVVTPVFNGAAFLREALESILLQGHRPIQIVIIDDGSTDESGAIAEGFGDPVLCRRQEHAGAAAARNRGVALAGGEFIAFLDADDLYTPNKLALQIPRLQARPEVDIVIGGQRYESLVAAGRGEEETAPFAPPPADHLSVQLGCGLFRREVFERIGRFDESFRLCDDWDWMLRAREAGVGLLLHRDLVLRQRLHGSNLTRDRAAGLKAEALVFKRSLDRRRARGGPLASLPPLSSFFEPESGGGESVR